MILGDRICDVMQKCRFTCAWRRDDQPALTHSERRHQVHAPCCVTVRHRLELDFFVWIDRGEFFKRAQPLIFWRLFSIDREQLDQLGATAAAPGLTINPHPVAQGEAANNFRSNKNILRSLHKIAFLIAQESEAFAGNFNNAFAKFGLGLSLFAGLTTALNRSRSIESLDTDVSTRRTNVP